MRYKYLLLLVMTVLLFSCKKEYGTVIPASPGSPPPPPPDDPVPTVLLKEIVIPSLPSPYYHFEYNEKGKMSFASFASGFFNYTIVYDGKRISELRNPIPMVGEDKLQYSYDDKGRVTTVIYINPLGETFKKCHFTYDGQRLIKMERERILAGVFLVDKTMTFTYHPDGNLFEITEHRPAIQPVGQTESTIVDRFEQYDNKINVDGFSLLHNEFFDHVLLLPDVKLQKNNPGKETLTGALNNYTVNYRYTYNDHDAPLTKTGELIFTSGPQAGQVAQTNSVFSYY